MKELIEKIYQLQTNKENLEKQKNEIQANIDALDAELEASKAELLKQMQSDGVNTFTADDIKAGTFHRKDIAWLDDKALLEYLTSTGQEQYINTKVTKSVAKAALKKAMKTNEPLKESLSPYFGYKETDYVIVTTTDNFDAMLKHIEEGK